MDLTVTYATDENGKRTGDIYHMIRVYLIDRDGSIREIYATGFFNPDVGAESASKHHEPILRIELVMRSCIFCAACGEGASNAPARFLDGPIKNIVRIGFFRRWDSRIELL